MNRAQTHSHYSNNYRDLRQPFLWSFGLPSFRFAEAANVTSFSDTLSDSAPSVVANHTIQFVTPTGLAAGEIIIYVPFCWVYWHQTLTAEDLDLKVNGVDQDLDEKSASGAIWKWLLRVNN